MRCTLWSLAILALAGCAGPAVREGRPLADGPPLAVTDMAGAAHDLDAALARGERVALVFWQTWCAPCAREAPALAAAVREHGSRLRFVGVVSGRDDTVDDAEVRTVAARWGYDAFPQVRDRDLSLARRLGVSGTPTLVILGAGREVLFHDHRPPESWQPYLANGACKDGVCPLPGDQ